jgi:hypothetical protein
LDVKEIHIQKVNGKNMSDSTYAQQFLAVLARIRDVASAQGIECETPDGMQLRTIEDGVLGCRVRMSKDDRSIEDFFSVSANSQDPIPEFLGMRVTLASNIAKAVSEARRRLTRSRAESDRDSCEIPLEED